MKATWCTWVAMAIAACSGPAKRPAGTWPPPETTTAPAADAHCDELPAAAARIVDAQIAEVPPDHQEAARRAVADALPKMNVALVESCKTDRWSVEATSCMTGGKTSADWDACTAKLTDDQQASLKQRLSAAVPQPDASVAAQAPSYDLEPDVGIAECDDYLRAIGRSLGCEALDDDTRGQIRAGADKLKKQWLAMPRKTAPDRQQVAQACTSAMKTLVQAAHAAGCSL